MKMYLYFEQYFNIKELNIVEREEIRNGGLWTHERGMEGGLEN